MTTNEDKEVVYVGISDINDEQKIAVFNNADALFDWNDLVRRNGGIVQFSDRLDVYVGVAGYPSGDKVTGGD